MELKHNLINGSIMAFYLASTGCFCEGTKILKHSYVRSGSVTAGKLMIANVLGTANGRT